MKWVLLLLTTFFLSACGIHSTDVVEYRQVTIVPVVERTCIYERTPIDVSTTTVQPY